MTHTIAPIYVICLCAEWCDTCRTYRTGFDKLAARFPGTRFHWVDIEEQAAVLGELDIENFPTMLINRGASILYYGSMEPYPEHLARILENFHEHDAQQIQADVHRGRRRCQEDVDLRKLIAHFL
jgi:thiol-disulfide isomerase/thioredoxin